ncbi:FecR family protein [Mucilaginibacter flavus]|uniref:FecR family protein n=1 Tax=Mucilaginibacter flavus TaxID=931504 RepID=UPI0025B590D5|nr:FecR family protein [Mucilaginibacter flavus]MDN3580315.1 FecR family protein [Mucilaginibacter flavus]
MNEIQLSELLDRYLNNTCTPEEKEVIDKWFALHQDKPDFTESLDADKRELLKTKMFSAITSEAYIEPQVQKNGIIRPLFKNRWVRVASAAILLLMARFLFTDKISPPVDQPAVAGLYIVFVNHTKNIIKKVLPDSSVVWLNPNTSLFYPKVFQAKSRNVSMNGDCFFEITKNPKRPFIISSQHMVTKVWGTSFRVLDNTDMQAALVTVVTGKVSVSKKGSVAANAGATLSANEVLLMPKQQVVYNTATNQLTANKQANVSALNIYKHIDLSFENARLTEIVKVLNQKFDANIKIKDDRLDKAGMTADLTDLNLPEVLEVLKTSMNLNYEISNDLIILKKTN